MLHQRNCGLWAKKEGEKRAERSTCDYILLVVGFQNGIICLSTPCRLKLPRMQVIPPRNEPMPLALSR